jgi:hypothetical protein
MEKIKKKLKKRADLIDSPPQTIHREVDLYTQAA